MINNDFAKLQKFLDETNSSNSTNDKVAVLARIEYKDDEFIQKILHYTYTGFKQYYVTTKNLQKQSKLCAVTPAYTNIFDLLDALSERKITGHEAIKETNGFIANNIEYKELIYSIFDRNLKNRMGTDLINRIIPNLIATFNVALANKYDENIAKKVNFSEDDWYISTKIDGCRTIIMIDGGGNILITSRAGNEFTTLDVLKEEIKKFNLTNVVLDGEICLVDEFGKENFQGIIKEIKNKNHTIKNPKFLMFDMLKLEDFIKAKSEEKFSERLKKLNKLLTVPHNTNIIEALEQTLVTDEIFAEKIKEASDKGWEGLMLRKDVPYEGDRTNELLKVKKFFDAEYIVTGIEVGPFRVIVDGSEVTEEMMRNVYIDHKGYQVSVGSGFSIDERRHFTKHPEDIIGKVILVKYFEETKNQSGGLSLRFPTVKALYGNKRDI